MRGERRIRLPAGPVGALACFLLVVLPSPAASAEPAPVLRPGDYWLYEVTKPGVPGKGQINISVEAAEPSGYKLKVLRVPSSGPREFEWTVMKDLAVSEERWSGGVKTYEPALRELPFPISVNAISQQKVLVTVTPTGANSSFSEFEHRTRVTRQESVSVPGGSFDSYVAEREDLGTSSKYAIWYSPAAGGLVKREYWEGDVLREGWALLKHSFGAAPPPPPSLEGLGPVGAGIAVGAMVLFVLGLGFLWQNGRLGGRSARLRETEERVVRPAGRPGYEIVTLTSSERLLRVAVGVALISAVVLAIVYFGRGLGGAGLGFVVGVALVGLLLLLYGIRGTETRKARAKTIAPAMDERPAPADEGEPGTRAPQATSPAALREAGKSQPAKPRARPPAPERRRTPEELEAEYEAKVAGFRALLKRAEPSRPEAKQAKLLLTKAELAARQGRHGEAVELLETASERLGEE